MADAKDMPGAEDERRGEERAPITLKVDYKRLNTFFADYTKNISKGGTFIRTNKPLEVGTRFAFVLTMPAPSAEEGESVRLELTGEVKWIVRLAEASSDAPAGMGIKFVFEREEDQKGVEELVTKLMRRSLGDHLADRLLANARR